VIHGRLSSAAVELSHDRRIAGRVMRLSAVSAAALAVIAWMAIHSLDAPPPIGMALVAGWLLMPTTLLASLLWPRLRFALVIPSSLVGGGLLVAMVGWLPNDPLAAAGWLLVTAGILMGGGLGLWFWYRVLPVPLALDDPLAPGRWGLIGVHALLVVTGLALVAASLR
jgi:hypothetical protein